MLDMAALAVLEQSGPVPQAELGRRLRLDPSDVTALVEEMSAADRVVRSVDPLDRRRRLVQVSEAGQAALDVARRVTEGVDDELLATLPPEVRAQLHDMLLVMLGDARSS